MRQQETQEDAGFEVFVASKATRESCKAAWERHSMSYGACFPSLEEARADMDAMLREIQNTQGGRFVHAEIIDISTEETIHEETWQTGDSGVYAMLQTEDARLPSP